MAFTDRDLQVADQASAGTTGHGGEAGQTIAGTAGSGAVYLVPEWVRVRPEDFGLLFYDTRSTRLTFVRSGDRLVSPPFTGSRRVLGRAALRGAGAPDGAALSGTGPSPAALSRLLDGLVAKGLLVVAEAE